MPRLAFLVVLACAACAAEFPARRSERSLADADLSGSQPASRMEMIPTAGPPGAGHAPLAPVPAKAEGPTPVAAPARSRAVLVCTAQVAMAVFDV
jgi:hypothetical protein